MPFMGLAPDLNRNIVAKTAAYTVTPEDQGKLFTNLGASGSVTYTLPPIANVWGGWSVEFYVSAGQTIVVAAPSGKLICFNNAAATSISFAQASELIGNSVEIIYDAAATKYMAIPRLASEGVTITIA